MAMIQSVERAAQILKALGAESPRLGITELSERLGLAKATVHGLLRTLESQELVEQDAETGKYRLGPALLQLGNAFLDNHELRARSLMWAESLATRSGPRSPGTPVPWARPSRRTWMTLAERISWPSRSRGSPGGRSHRSPPWRPSSRGSRRRGAPWR